MIMDKESELRKREEKIDTDYKKFLAEKEEKIKR